MSLYNEEQITHWVDNHDVYGRFVFETSAIDVWLGIRSLPLSYVIPTKKHEITTGVSDADMDYIEILMDDIRIKIYIHESELVTAIHAIVTRVVSDLQKNDSTKIKVLTVLRELSTNLSCVDF